MPLALHHHDPATLARRKLLSRTWAGVVVGWSLIRTLIVWAAVGDYGLNPWIYLAIDLASAMRRCRHHPAHGAQLHRRPLQEGR